MDRIALSNVGVVGKVGQWALPSIVMPQTVVASKRWLSGPAIPWRKTIFRPSSRLRPQSAGDGFSVGRLVIC